MENVMKKLLYVCIMLLTVATVNANLEQVENKLDAIMNQASNNPTLANKLYDVLENSAKSFWIGEFPSKQEYLKNAKNSDERRGAFIRLLNDSKDRIVSFLKKIGNEDDQKEVIDALVKLV